MPFFRRILAVLRNTGSLDRDYRGGNANKLAVTGAERGHILVSRGSNRALKKTAQVGEHQEDK